MTSMRLKWLGFSWSTVLVGASFHAGVAIAVPSFTNYVASGLNSPIGITHADDGSGRVFVIEQGGNIRVVRDDALLTPPFLTLGTGLQCRLTPGGAPQTLGFSSGGEQGLLGLAFHPDYGSNGFFYVSFTDGNGDSVIARFAQGSPSADVVTATDSCLVILRVDQDFSNHNGGHIAFNPTDGYLYFGLGDGGSGGDPCNRAQALNPANLSNSGSCAVDGNFTSSGGDANSRALLGKMLRIDVDHTTTAPAPGLCGRGSTAAFANYAIPSDNPFADGATTNGCDEVDSYGLRNPWRWSFDRATSNMFIGDVGQGTNEEIDETPSGTHGRNYGWNCREGFDAYGTGCSPAPVTQDPLTQYAQTAGRCSVTGGYVYRGPLASMQGRYFFADYCTGEVWTVNDISGSWGMFDLFVDFAGTVTSFGEDEDGDLYVTNGSAIMKLTDPIIFLDGFE